MSKLFAATLGASVALGGAAALAAEKAPTAEPTLFERIFGERTPAGAPDATAKQDRLPARPLYDADRYDLDPHLIDWLQRLRSHPEGR